MKSFKQNYESFITSLHSTASKMTTHGIETKDIEDLTQQFNKCENTLNILIKNTEVLSKVKFFKI